MTTQDSVPAVGAIVAEKYEITAQLGEGAMGAVLEGTHLVTGKRFAIKWMLPQTRLTESGIQRFVREAQAVCRVHHANVVEVYDIDYCGQACYMVMELLQGESLKDYLENRGPLPVLEALDLMCSILHGVAAAHAASVVHRDLKPGNIFLSRPPAGTGRRVIPKILDFGISKVPDEPNTSAPLTQVGAVIGTPEYMSPEQLSGWPADHRADIYALGAILYEMLAGQRPFEADSYSRLRQRVLNELPTPLRSLRPDAPEELCDAVHRALAQAPDDRHPSTAAFLEELLAAQALCAPLSGDPLASSALRGPGHRTTMPMPETSTGVGPRSLGPQRTGTGTPSPSGGIPPRKAPRVLFGALIGGVVVGTGLTLLVARSWSPEASIRPGHPTASEGATRDTHPPDSIEAHGPGTLNPRANVPTGQAAPLTGALIPTGESLPSATALAPGPGSTTAPSAETHVAQPASTGSSKHNSNRPAAEPEPAKQAATTQEHAVLSRHRRRSSTPKPTSRHRATGRPATTAAPETATATEVPTAPRTGYLAAPSAGQSGARPGSSHRSGVLLNLEQFD